VSFDVFWNFFIVASNAAFVVVDSQVMYVTFATAEDPEAFDVELHPARARPVRATAAMAAVNRVRCMALSFEW
jgi:hypothetical protein